MVLKLLGIIAGAALGYSYYYFIGCRTGACAIASNPWIATSYGALIGGLITWSSPKKTDNSQVKNLNADINLNDD